MTFELIRFGTPDLNDEIKFRVGSGSPQKRFKQQMKEIAHKMTWTCIRRGNLKRETESLFIVAENNVLKTNFVKKLIIHYL